MNLAFKAGRALAVLSVVAIALIGPAANAATARIGVPFGMRIGDEIAIADTTLVVRFAGVVEDSRCPIDVLCVWAGVLRIALSVTAGALSPREIEIDTMGRTADASGFTFTLVTAKPSRRASVPVEPGDYGVVIRADRVSICCGPPPPAPN